METPTQPPAGRSVIVPIGAAESGQVRLTWLSSFDKGTLRRFLDESPVPSFWIPETGEYAIAAPWRGRPEVGQIVEVSARRNREDLVRRMIDDGAGRGARAMVLSVSEAWREGRWYRQHGFGELDSIVTMVLAPNRPPPSQASDLQIRRYDPGDAADLFTVDRTSFPWLWWNDPVEFESYRLRPDVCVWTGWLNGPDGETMVSYASATLRGNRGHLDRIAVRHSDQGRGFGRAMLLAALASLAETGAREIALTTQLHNTVSQTLYRSVGFRRTNEIEPIVGCWTGDPVTA